MGAMRITDYYLAYDELVKNFDMLGVLIKKKVSEYIPSEIEREAINYFIEEWEYCYKKDAKW